MYIKFRQLKVVFELFPDPGLGRIQGIAKKPWIRNTKPVQNREHIRDFWYMKLFKKHWSLYILDPQPGI
jgi:hypothetical protein